MVWFMRKWRQRAVHMKTWFWCGCTRVLAELWGALVLGYRGFKSGSLAGCTLGTSWIQACTSAKEVRRSIFLLVRARSREVHNVHIVHKKWMEKLFFLKPCAARFECACNTRGMSYNARGPPAQNLLSLDHAAEPHAEHTWRSEWREPCILNSGPAPHVGINSTL